MRLTFSDWKMEGGVVTERRASCGPLTYSVSLRDSKVFATINSDSYIPAKEGKTDNHGTVARAERACESHLQAILDAAEGESP